MTLVLASVLAVAAFIVAGAALYLAVRAGRAVAGLDELEKRIDRMAQGFREELHAELRTDRIQLARLASGNLRMSDLQGNRPFREVLFAELQATIAAGANIAIVDVREPHEFVAGHVPGALNIPVNSIPGRISEIPGNVDEIFVYCARGQRSAAASDYLARQSGYLNVVNVGDAFGNWAGPLEH